MSCFQINNKANYRNSWLYYDKLLNTYTITFIFSLVYRPHLNVDF